MSKHLLIRADANASIGTGHVMRCLALAQAWQDEGGTAAMACRELPEGLRQRVQQESIEIISLAAAVESEDALRLAQLATERANCVVLDGYKFGIVHQRALNNAGIRQLFIDDYGHASEYIADIVLNQNISAEESLYRNRATGTQLLLGTRFALLRREFRRESGWEREFRQEGGNVLVTMGGADESNVTLRVLETIQKLHRADLKVRAVVGPASRHRIAVDEFCRTCGFACEAVSQPNMPELMKWADIAVTAAGSTCWEIMFMGLPFITVCIAENQSGIAARLSQDRVADAFAASEVSSRSFIEALTRLIDDIDLRNRLSAKARALVDGCGAVRVVTAINR